MIALFTRRPVITYAARRLIAMSVSVPYLDAASMLRFGQMCQAVWAYIDTIRQKETAQAISDQQRLAGIEAAVRNLAVDCKRYYLNAVGDRALTLTQDSSDAIDQMLAYDVTTTASFDIEATVLRILRGARIT